MPVTISDDEYKLLASVKGNILREQKLASINSMDTLEHDIDLPMKKLVAYFALLGCRPIFACCGFDYTGQPTHKTHEYGNAYIMFDENDASSDLFTWLLENNYMCYGKKNQDRPWRTYLATQNRRHLSSSFVKGWEDVGYPWANKNCIHFYEIGAINISWLEKILVRHKYDDFMESVTLCDTNEHYKNTISYWQYPELRPWVIEKRDWM